MARLEESTLAWLIRKSIERQIMTDDEIDIILENAPEVEMNEGLKERALKAMKEAQEKRNKGKL